MMNLQEQIEEAGLSSKEANVYLRLLQHDPIGGGALSKLLNMDRTHTYNVLQNLISKGLVSSIVKENKTLFQAASPKNLLNQIHRKEEILQTVIPKLEALEKTSGKKSAVTLLEGKSGIQTMFRSILESREKEILVFGGTGKSYNVLQYEMGHIAKKAINLKIVGRVITSRKLKNLEFLNQPNVKLKFIEEVTSSATMIFGDNISIIFFDEKPFVIMIENKSVADSYRKHFEYMWKIASS